MLEYEDKEFFPEELNSSDNGNNGQDCKCFSIDKFQNVTINSMEEEIDKNAPDDNYETNSFDEYSRFYANDDASILTNEVKSLSDAIDSHTTTRLASKVQKLAERSSSWIQNGVRKAKSPRIPVKISGTQHNIMATIDEGSEINCLDEAVAARCKIRYTL